MRLTACLIVRDEERYLGACLSRITGFADSLVVVDTGSSDRSREISRAHGAVVLEEPWRNNFSHARNVALDHAAGEWILYIDADELLEGRVEDLVCLDDPKVVAATVSFRAASNLTTYREYRLFRNRPDIRFRGVIHETIRPDIEAIVAQEQALVIHAPFSIEHLGYEGDLSSKHLRNHGMLLQAVHLDPDRIYLWHALGECEMGLGYAERAEKAFRQALARIHGRESQPSDALIFADLIGLHFAENEITLNDIDELVAEAGSLHGSDPLVLWWSARYLMSKGEISIARKLLNQLVQPGAADIQYRTLAYDKRLFGAYSWALLGSCDLAEKDYVNAVLHLQQAQEAHPGNTEVGVKLEYARACALRESTGAMRCG